MVEVTMDIGGEPTAMLFVACSGSDGFQSITPGGGQQLVPNTSNPEYFDALRGSQRNPNIVMINLSLGYNSEQDPANNPNNLPDQQTVVYPDPTQYAFPEPQEPSQDMLVDPTGMATSPAYPNDIFVLDAQAGGEGGEILDFSFRGGTTALAGPHVVTASRALASPVDMTYDPTTGNLDVVEDGGGGSVVSVSLSGGSGSVNGTVKALQGPSGPITNLGSSVDGITANPANGTAFGTIYVDTAETANASAEIWQIEPKNDGSGSYYNPTTLSLPSSDVLSEATGMYCDGTNLYIATSPSPNLSGSEANLLSMAAQSGDTSKFPTGIVVYNLSTGSLDTSSLTRAAGLFSLPQGVAEDSQGNLYVADETAVGDGAIIQVDPTGQATLLAWGNQGYFDGPVGIAFDSGNQNLYVINAGDSSFATHSIVQVSLDGSSQSYVSDNQHNDLNVLSGIAVADTNDLYVLDQGGNVVNPDTQGQVYGVQMSGSGENNGIYAAFGPQFPTASSQDVRAQPDGLTVDPLNGSVYACTEGSGGADGAVVSVTASSVTAEESNDANNNLVGTDGITVGHGPYDETTSDGVQHETIFVSCTGQPTAMPPIPPSVTAFPEIPADFPVTQQRVSTGTGASNSLDLVTGLTVYDPPGFVNYVDFETDNFSQVATHTNATIVSSPALDGKYSLQLQRNNSIANAEIRQSGTTYFNLPTASYSFEFEYASNPGNGGIANFNDTASGYKAALHLSSTDHLLFYDVNGNLLATGSTVLQPNQVYTISAEIGIGSNASWVIRINGNVEMSGTGNLGTNNNGALEFGGDSAYTTNYYYDDVEITGDINQVGFETGNFSQLAAHNNATIVSSPALDGSYSLELQRNNSVANAEIRESGTLYYNLATAYYSFLFDFTSNSGNAGIVNFNDTAAATKPPCT